MFFFSSLLARILWSFTFTKLAVTAMLSPLKFSKRIPTWIYLKLCFSSVSCTNTIPINPEIDQHMLNSPDFETKIQSLSNKLHPDNLIKVLNNTTDIHSAIKIFKWASLQKRFNHTADTHFWMILKLGMAGNVKEMEGFCQNMVKEGCPGVECTLLSLIDSFVRHNRLNEAIRVLVNMNLGGYKPSIEVFNSVLGAIVEEKRGFGEVVFVYKEMVKAGAAPTVDTLNYLLEVLFETGRIDIALDQYRRMNKKGCRPNSRTFEILIKGLIANNQVEDSVKILHEMLELGCEPELSFYKCTIPLFCKENKMEEATSLLRMIRASNFAPDSLIYSALIQCLCESLLLDDAINLLEEMMQSSLTPGDDVFLDVVNGFCKLGRTSEAIKLLEDKEILATSPYNLLLSACCHDDKIFLAKCLLDKMCKRNMADADSWNILIRWLCEKAEVRKAYELLGRMIIFSLLPNCATHSALVIGNTRLRKHEDALKIFLQIHAKRWVLDSVSYSELIEGLCRAKMYIEAIEVFHYMSKNRCSLLPSSFNMLIKGICDSGMVNEAAEIQLLAYGRGNYCANAAYNSIMYGLFKSDKAKSVLVLLSQMLVQGCDLDAEGYCILIQSLIAENRIKDCALFFSKMVNDGFVPDPDTIYSILSCLANHSQLHLISTTVDKLVSDSGVLDSAMYNILVNGLWKEGNKNEARRLLDVMLDKGWVPDATTHRSLIGSVEGEEAGEGTLTNEKSAIKDDVFDILAEGLGET